MVAIIKALGSKAEGGGAADAARYFTELAAADYYAKGGEPLGQWVGEAAKTLGLHEPPTYESLLAVLSGSHPVTRQPLVKQRKSRKGPHKLDDNGRDADEPGSAQSTKRRERCPGVDICFTVPEAINILRAVGGEEVRRAIDEAIDAASKRLIHHVEKHFLLARRGFLGVDQHQANLVVAMFDHDTSRADKPEPHRHRHCVIANLGQTEDGRWSAIHTRLLFDWTRALGPVFRCILTNELKERINLPLDAALDENGRLKGWAEIEGIPASLRKLWSTRHDEIEQFAAGDAKLSGLSTAKAKAAAQVKTRLTKSATPPRAELYAQWEAEGRKHGFGPEHVADLLRRRPEQESVVDPYAAALREAMAELTDSEANFTRRELIQRVAERLSHTGIDGIQIISRIDRDLSCSPDIVRLADQHGGQHFTTRSSWAYEQKLLADVDLLRHGKGASVSDRKVAAVLSQHTTATAEQKRAIEALLKDKSQLRTLTGVAGSGKTFVLNAVREGLEFAGYRVQGGALSGIAKEELSQQAKITSRTIASSLYHLDRSTLDLVRDRVRHHVRQLWRAARGQRTYAPTKIELGNKDVWIIDEAGMLDTCTMSRCLHHARKTDATVILVGDSCQLSPIGAGGPFQRIADTVGGPKLEENRRQRHERDRQAVKLIREGKGQEALEIYAQEGRLTIGKNKLDTLRKLVQFWGEVGGAERPKDHQILTQTRREAQVINQRCQRERQAKRQVARHGGVRVAEGMLYCGDRVLFHKAYRAAGIENGQQGTILQVNPLTRRITVCFDHLVTTGPGKKQKQPVVVPLRALDKDAVSLCYAATTHKMQGRTVENVLMFLGGTMVDRELAYVQSTRAREATHLFVDRAHAGEELQDLANSISKSRAKKLAHDLIDPVKCPPRAPSLEIER